MMRKMKFFSMLRVMAIPLALAIYSGSAYAAPELTTEILFNEGWDGSWVPQGGSVEWVLYGSGTGKAGEVDQNRWDISTDVLSLTNNETFNGTPCRIKDAWVRTDGSIQLLAPVTENASSAYYNKVYTFEYTVPTGEEAAKNDIEVYLSLDKYHRKIVKICDKGTNKVNFTIDTKGDYYIMIRGRKQSSVEKINISSTSLTMSTRAEVEAREESITALKATDLIFENNPLDGTVYGNWYIVDESLESMLTNDISTWGPCSTAGHMYLNTAQGKNTYQSSSDWLITNTGKSLKAGTTYRMSFGIKNNNNTVSEEEEIAVYVGKGREVNDLKAGTKIFDYAFPGKTNGSTNNIAALDDLVNFTPTEDGVYYFGIWCHSVKRTAVEIWDFNVEGGTSEPVFDIDTPFELPFDGTQEVKGNYLTGGAYTNTLPGTDGYYPDFSADLDAVKSAFNWKDSKVDITAPYEINVAGVTMKLQGKEGCGVPTLSSTNSKLQFPATFTDGRIYFNAPSGFYFKSIKLAGEGMGASTDFDVNVDGTCAYSEGFVWTATAGAVESEVMFESNLADAFAISSFVVEFVNPDTFVGKPTETTYYSSTIGAEDGLFDKGWQPFNAESTWSVGYYDETKDIKAFTGIGGGLLRSPKFYLENNKEYVVKMETINTAYTGYYDYNVYLIPQNQLAVSEGDCVMSVTGGLTNVNFEKVIKIETTDGEYCFVIEPVQNANGTNHAGVALKRFAVNLLNSPIANIYKFTHADGYSSEVLTRSTATVFDFSEYPEAVTVAPTNTNAYILGWNNPNITVNAGNKLTPVDAENNTYRASSISIDGDKPFYFGYDVDVTESITFNRTLNNELKYATLILPFKVEVANFGNNEFYVFNGFKEVDNIQCLNFKQVSENIAPYTPIMLKPDDANLVLNGSDGIVSHEMTTAAEKNIFTTPEQDGWQMAWSTEEFTLTQDELATNSATKNKDVYFLKDNIYYRATTGFTVKPFRVFYLKTKAGNAMGAASYNFLINNDIPTGLESLFEDGLRGNEAYSTEGIRVNEGYKGIQIRNGKKMIENR